MEALLGEPAGGAPLLGALKFMKGKEWGWATPYMGAQETWSGLLYRELRELAVSGSGVGAFRGEGDLAGGLPCWGPWWIGRKRSRDRHLSP
jgi:hypothetical protein